jgi:hypothetical protein
MFVIFIFVAEDDIYVLLQVCSLSEDSFATSAALLVIIAVLGRAGSSGSSLS